VSVSTERLEKPASSALDTSKPAPIEVPKAPVARASNDPRKKRAVKTETADVASKATNASDLNAGVTKETDENSSK